MICYPWKMYAEYADGKELTFTGNSEEDCMEKIVAAEATHGEIVAYGGICDEDYVSGEYIGRENFIYD